MSLPDYDREVLRLAQVICDDELDNIAEDATDGPGLFHLQGLLLARRRGYADASIACLRRSLVQPSSTSGSYLALGDVLSREDRHDEALAAYRSGLERDPRSAAAYEGAAVALQMQGQWRESREILVDGLQRLLGLPGESARLHRTLGDVLRTGGELTEAIVHCEYALRIAPEDPAVYRALGNARLARREWGLALAAFQRGLTCHTGNADDADEVDLRVGAGEALIQLGRLDEARASFEAALVIDASHVRASCGLVRIHEPGARHDESAAAWFHLGTALRTHLRPEEARLAFRRAITLAPGHLRAQAALAEACIACGDPQNGVPWAQATVNRTPDDKVARVDLGTAFHLLGEVDRGWDEFAHCYDAHEVRALGIDLPLWDGSDLNGRTILLWTDQGRGDVIQSLRWIPLARQRGGRVIVRSHHKDLIPLIERIEGVEQVVRSDAPLPHADVHVPLTLFPAFVPTHRPRLRNDVPYLAADPDRRAYWKARLGEYAGHTIGLSWSGNPDARSAPTRFVSLAAFAALAGLRDTRFVSLQYGAKAAELFAAPNGFYVERVMDLSTTIDDVAALMSSVDLVITVDTMIAHLAGALGLPVWTLLRHAASWQWQQAGETTPSYPTMRLFRQSRAGDWRGVIERIRAALAARAADV